MLAVKRLADVAPEVNLRNLLHSGKIALGCPTERTDVIGGFKGAFEMPSCLVQFLSFYTVFGHNLANC